MLSWCGALFSKGSTLPLVYGICSVTNSSLTCMEVLSKLGCNVVSSQNTVISVVYG